MSQRKLIEVALPLDAINVACKIDKDRSVGHVRNLHKWFAPMPLPAWRALLFATLVDDPEDEEQRDRLLQLTERLVVGENAAGDSSSLRAAQQAIELCWPGGAPTIADPFCGGGSTLIEAQRLGLEAVGSDLNPVPVLISKVLCELVPQTAGRSPLHTATTEFETGTRPYDGLLTDVTYYADLVGRRAKDRLSVSYGQSDDVIAWLWCRTVACPNPACRAKAPLLSSRWLSRATNEERYVDLRFADGATDATFELRSGKAGDIAGTTARSGATCARCKTAISFGHIRSEGQAGRLGLRLTAVARQTAGGRSYSAGSPSEEGMGLATDVPDDVPRVALVGKATQNIALYGFTHQADLYTPRQLSSLMAFSDEVAKVYDDVRRDGGDTIYAETVTSILGLCVGRLAQLSSSLVRWNARVGGPPKAEPAFGRHDVPMSWDFAETNPFGGSRGGWAMVVRSSLSGIATLDAMPPARVHQADARTAPDHLAGVQVIWATDPPYFDQIAYADLSDYFYIWLRRALRRVHPDLFATLATPKETELAALPGRHNGDRSLARNSFVEGFAEVFGRLASTEVDDAPFLVVYAFKEQTGSVTGQHGAAPGWEAILEALVAGGASVVGTWPIRGTVGKRMIGLGSNAVATYVVLVCRKRPDLAPRITRSHFTRLLRTELVGSIAELQHANIAPVDLAQAVIGPGMQVYSRHSSVVETDGSRVGVADALKLINRTLGEVLDEQEGDLDPDSRWAVTWYEDHGFESASFGDADQLARAKGIAVDALVQAGIVTSGAGKVGLIGRDALVAGWDPATDRRATAWEAVQYLVRALEADGELGAARLYARLGALADPARELAYRLFQVAERTGRIEEAIAYNGLVASWPEIARLADDLPADTSTEALF